MSYKLQVFRNKVGQFWWHLLSGNGQILAHSEMYTRRSGCMKAVNKLSRALNCKVDK